MIFPSSANRAQRRMKVLAMATALPGPALETSALLALIERRFGIAVARKGMAFAEKLGIRSRHVCRDFAARHEAPRPGHSNPELAAAALEAALAQSGLRPNDLRYLIGHTATPDRLIPPNIAFVADHLGFDGPYLELRQACTGFANALVIAQGLVADGRLRSSGRRPGPSFSIHSGLSMRPANWSI